MTKIIFCYENDGLHQDFWKKIKSMKYANFWPTELVRKLISGSREFHIILCSNIIYIIVRTDPAVCDSLTVGQNRILPCAIFSSIIFLCNLFSSFSFTKYFNTFIKNMYYLINNILWFINFFYFDFFQFCF